MIAVALPRILFAALLIATMADAARARAQEVITLAEAIRIVREESLSAMALRADIDVADADVALAGVHPNPVLSYVGMGRFDGSSQAINGSQHQVWLDVPLLVAGQHDARRDVARAAATAVRAEVAADLLGLETETRRAFLEMLSAQARVEVRATDARELRDLAAIVEGRASSGAQSRYDAIRLSIAIAHARAMLASAEADARRASARLAALAGRPGWWPRADGTLEVHELSYAALDDAPSVRAARARLLAGERDVRRAEAEQVPEIRIGLGAYMTTDGDSGSAYGGLTIPLPILDDGGAATHRARAARVAFDARREAIEHLVRCRLEGALTVLSARRDALAAFDANTRDRSPELAEMARSAYQLGASTIFELLDSFRTRLETELSRIDLVEAAVNAEIDVLASVGAR